MADFVEKAFHDAEAIFEEKEFQAYRKAIVTNFNRILMTAGEDVWLDAMNKLSGLLIRSGHVEDIADFIIVIAIICFHEGYQAGRLER